MRFLVIALLVAATHFSLTAFAPAASGKAWILWPFATDSKPALGGVGGLPQESGSVLTPALAGLAALSFVGALFSLLGWVVPSEWWTPLVAAGVAASIALHVLYMGTFSLLPIAVDVVLLWGVFVQHWSVAGLQSQ